MRRFVIADLHGNHKGLMQVLEQSKFDFEEDMLITLGDIVDGYPDVWECVETLLKVKNLVTIKGNHDDWFLEFLTKGEHPISWHHGGKATVESYIGHSERECWVRPHLGGWSSNLTTFDVDKRHVEFFKNQKLYVIIDDMVFVHGGFNRHYEIDKQGEEFIYYWDRDLWSQALSYSTSSQMYPFKMKTPFKLVFIGHTPTINWGKTTPMQGANVINLDTGGGYKAGKVTLMNIDDVTQYFQSDKGETLYNYHTGRL